MSYNCKVFENSRRFRIDKGQMRDELITENNSRPLPKTAKIR